MKIIYTAGGKEGKPHEVMAVKDLNRLLSSEGGFVMPNIFLENGPMNREIDAVLVLPDMIFLIDFKNIQGQRIEVDGLNGQAYRLQYGYWSSVENTLPGYAYAAKELASLLKKSIPNCPRIYAVMAFTPYEMRPDQKPHVSFAGGDPQRPQIKQGVSACRLEHLPKVIAALRAASPSKVLLGPMELALVKQALLSEAKAPQPRLRTIDGYVLLTEHHKDPFLNCTIYQGEHEILHEPVWVKEYPREYVNQEQRARREKLALRHADVHRRMPQHPHIVTYRATTSTDANLYVMLVRSPGVFLSELLKREPLGQTTICEGHPVSLTSADRLAILGGLLSALEFLTQQPDFEQSSYRDLRPDSIFLQYVDSTPVVQLFHLDNIQIDRTRFAQATTRYGHLKEGRQCVATWDEYASPELIEYIETGQHTRKKTKNAQLGVRSDIYSWGILAWEIFTGERPFADIAAKYNNLRKPWPDQQSGTGQGRGQSLTAKQIDLITHCLSVEPEQRPTLATLRKHFVQSEG